jgi:hypothetical protein
VPKFKSGAEWTGNAGGRPKKPPPVPPPNVKALARDFGPDAVALLGEVMRDKNAPRRDRMFAATTLLDRGFGKPQQIIEATLSTFEQMSEAQLLEYLTSGQIIEGEVVREDDDADNSDNDSGDNEPEDDA